LAESLSAEHVSAALAAQQSEPAPGKLAQAQAWIDPAYAADTVEEICGRLRARAEPEAQAALSAILRNSPTSLKLALRALRRGRALGKLDASLAMELNVASHCLFGHDFPEGIRAAVVDKDRNPHWSPDRLEEVSEAVVESYFEAMKPD
jgi:enoyl-CoA hydratase